MLYVRLILTVFLFDLSVFLTVDVTGDTAYDYYFIFFFFTPINIFYFAHINFIQIIEL